MLDFCTRDRTPCLREPGKNGMHGMSVDKWLKHSRTHCHDWHLPSVEKFRDEVAKTYTAR